MTITITQIVNVYTCTIEVNYYTITAHHRDYRQVQIIAFGKLLDTMWYVLRDEGMGGYEKIM